MPAPLYRSLVTALCSAAALVVAHAQPAVPSTSPGVPTPVPGSAIPAGQNTGAPGSSSSLPLGTPAAPAVLAPSGGTAAARAAARTPPATSQSPISRTRNPRVDEPAAIDTMGRPVGTSGSPGPVGGRTTAQSARDEGRAGTFPSGLRDCVGQADRAARAACASALYGPGR